MDVMQFPRMVVSSRDGWDLVAQARPPMDWLFRRLVLPMSLLPPLMILLASGGVGERVFPEAGFGNWLIAAVLFFVAEHFSVPIMANSIRQAMASARPIWTARSSSTMCWASKSPRSGRSSS